MSLAKADILRQLDDLKGKLPLVMTNRGRVIYDRCIEKLKEFFNSVDGVDLDVDIARIVEWDSSLDNNLYRVIIKKILQYLRGEISLEVLGKGRKSRKKSKVTEFVLDEEDSIEEDGLGLDGEGEDGEEGTDDVIRSDIKDNTGFVDITKGGDNMRPQERSILTLEDKVRIYQRDKYGRLITIGDYTVKEITPEGDLEAFLNNYVVPIYGGGIYEIYKILTSGQLKHIRSFRFADKDDKDESSLKEQVASNTEINTIKELLYRMLEKTMTLKDEDPTTWFARYRLIREIMKDFERVEKSNDYKYIDGIVDKLKELEAEVKQKQQVMNTGLDANTLIMRDLINDLINAVKDLKESKKEKDTELQQFNYEDFGYHDRQYIDDKLEDLRKEVREVLNNKTDWGAIIQAISPVLVEIYRSRVEADKMNTEKMDRFFELMMTQYAKTTELILSLYNSNGHNKYLYEFINSFKDELNRIREEVKESLSTRNESVRSLKDILEEIRVLKEVSGLISNTGEGMLDKIVKLIDRAPKIIETISSLSGMANVANVGVGNVGQLPNLGNVSGQRPALVRREPVLKQEESNLIQEQMHNIILNILNELKNNKPELVNEFKGYLYNQDGTVNQEGVKLILRESGIDYDDNMLGQLYKVLQNHQKEYIQVLENKN